MTRPPYVVKADGTLLDRETQTHIGVVVLTSEGWVVEGLNTRYGPLGIRYLAVKAAWADWNRIRMSARIAREARESTTTTGDSPL